MHIGEAAAALSGRDAAAIHNNNAAICRDFCFTNYKAWSQGKSPHATGKLRKLVILRLELQMASSAIDSRDQSTPEAMADRAIFERASRRYLKMSAEEFLEKWNNGFFKQHPELAHKAADVALLLPLLSAR